MLLKRPALPAICVLILALGIGADTAIFSIAHAVLLQQLPFEHAERLFWSLSALANWSVNLTGQGDAERLNGVRVSANLFDTLGADAAIGRALKPEDDRPGNPHVVVISYGLWQRRFGGDNRLIGKPLDLNGQSYTVVGVLQPNFLFPIPGVSLYWMMRKEWDYQETMKFGSQGRKPRLSR